MYELFCAEYVPHTNPMGRKLINPCQRSYRSLKVVYTNQAASSSLSPAEPYVQPDLTPTRELVTISRSQSRLYRTDRLNIR